MVSHQSGVISSGREGVCYLHNGFMYGGLGKARNSGPLCVYAESGPWEGFEVKNKRGYEQKMSGSFYFSRDLVRPEASLKT